MLRPWVPMVCTLCKRRLPLTPATAPHCHRCAMGQVVDALAGKTVALTEWEAATARLNVMVKAENERRARQAA